MRSQLQALILAAQVVGCAAIPPPDVLVDLEEIAESPSAKRARELAPDAVAEAERLAREARQAAEGDDFAAAQILGEEAVAAFAEAVAAARAVEAERRHVEVKDAVGAAEKRLAQLEVEHQRVEADLRAVEARLEVLHNLEQPEPSGDATGARADARRNAARAMLVDATVTCGAAKLLAGERDLALLDEAQSRVAELRKAVDDLTEAPPVDGAMRVRAQCLEALTEVRRTVSSAEGGAGTDALLEALSSAKLGTVQRDARGVVVIVRGLFDERGLSKRGRAAVERLIAVAKEHPAPILVVAHEARGRAAEEPHRSAALVAALRAALGEGRVSEPQLAGTHRPLVDPKGAYASDNRRIELVFVTSRSL